MDKNSSVDSNSLISPGSAVAVNGHSSDADNLHGQGSSPLNKL